MEASVIIDQLKALPAPALAAAVLVPALDMIRRRSAISADRPASPRPDCRLHPGTGIAIAAAMLVGLWASKAGGWSIPPRQSTDWFAVAIEAGLAATVLIALVPGAKPQLAVRVLGCAAIATGVCWKLARQTWAVPESVAWLGGLTLGGALTWVAFDRLGRGEVAAPACDPASIDTSAARPAPAWSGPLVVAVWSMMLSQALSATDSLLLGKVAAMLAACFGVATAVAFFRPRLRFAGGPAGIAALLGIVVVFSGAYYSGLKLWMAVLLGAAPVVAALVDALVLRRVGGLWRGVLRAAAVAALPGIVLAVAIPAAIKASEDMGY